MIRARMPDAPVDSLDMIFKPEIIRRFADCGVTFLDSAEDVLQLALNYLHLDPNTTRPEDYQRRRAAAARRAPLHPRLRFVRVHERARQRRVLHLHVLVGRLRDLPRARQGRRRRRAPGLHRAERGRQRLIRRAADSRRRAAPAGGAQVPQLHARAAGDRRDHQRHPLRQRQPGGQTPTSIRRSSTIRRSIRRRRYEARLYRAGEVGPALERLRTRTWTRIKTNL